MLGWQGCRLSHAGSGVPHELVLAAAEIPSGQSFFCVPSAMPGPERSPWVLWPRWLMVRADGGSRGRSELLEMLCAKVEGCWRLCGRQPLAISEGICGTRAGQAARVSPGTCSCLAEMGGSPLHRADPAPRGIVTRLNCHWHRKRSHISCSVLLSVFMCGSVFSCAWAQVWWLSW